MSYLRDAIMESNQMEDEVRFQKAKNPPELKGRKKQEIKECGNAPAEDIQEGIVKDTIGAVGDVANKVSKVCDVISEDAKPLKEDADFVNIEDIIPESSYVESLSLTEDFVELPDRYQKGRDGSPEFESNDKRLKREATYRKYANIDDDFKITEDNINKWALNRTCMEFRCDPDKLTAELLHQPVTGLERY